MRGSITRDGSSKALVFRLRHLAFRLLVAVLGVLVGCLVWGVWYVNQPPAPNTLYIGDSMITSWQISGLLPSNAFMGGRGGEASSDVLWRWRSAYRDKQHWDKALIWMGTNDVAYGLSDERYQDNVRELVTNMQRRDVSAITIVGILPPGKSQAALVDKDRVRRLDDWLRQYAAQMSLRYVDLSYLVGVDGYLLPQYIEADGLHLNALGYSVVDGIVNGEISALLYCQSSLSTQPLSDDRLS
jgi:lysophospholipase L1-like esterase